MLELAIPVCDHYPELDRDLVLIGILFHDLGKIRELGAMPANDYTPEGRLVGHIVIGRDLLLERCRAIDDFPADLLLHLEHLILSHQGRLEFSSPVEPKTPEAFVLHFLDDLDSKLAQLRQARDLGEDPQRSIPVLRGLSRIQARIVALMTNVVTFPAGSRESGLPVGLLGLGRRSVRQYTKGPCEHRSIAFARQTRIAQAQRRTQCKT